MFCLFSRRLFLFAWLPDVKKGAKQLQRNMIRRHLVMTANEKSSADRANERTSADRISSLSDLLLLTSNPVSSSSNPSPESVADPSISNVKIKEEFPRSCLVLPCLALPII